MSNNTKTDTEKEKKIDFDALYDIHPLAGNVNAKKKTKKTLKQKVSDLITENGSAQIAKENE